MHIELLSRYEELAAQSEAWNSLAGGVPFLRWEWLGTWWRHFGRGRQLFVPTVWDDERRLIGLAPWYVEGHAPLTRVVRFLGSGEVCTDYLSLLASRGNEFAVADAIADWLHSATDSEKRWDLLEMDGATKDDPAMWRLIERLTVRGNTLHRRETLNCWRIALPATWDEYLAMQSKSHRKQVRRALTRAQDLSRAKLHIATNAEELVRGWNALVDLHQRRRTSLGEVGCFSSTRFRDFLCEASTLLLAADVLRLYWLEFDGSPIAAEYALREEGVTYVYQAGVDPNRLAEEPGRMMAATLIHRAIEEGQHGFDYLRGDEPYKAHWRAQPRRLTEWRIVPQRAIPQLRHTAWVAGGAVKHWVQGRFGMPSVLARKHDVEVSGADRNSAIEPAT